MQGHKEETEIAEKWTERVINWNIASALVAGTKFIEARLKECAELSKGVVGRQREMGENRCHVNAVSHSTLNLWWTHTP